MKALRFTFIFITICLLLLTTSCQETDHTDHTDNKSIINFLSSYNKQQDTPEQKKQADSVGNLILSQENTQSNRKLLSDYIEKTKAGLYYVNELQKRSLAKNDIKYLGQSHFHRAKEFDRTFAKDSSLYNYTKSEMLFRHSKDTVNLNLALTYKAIILVNNRLYEEAETSILEAMSLSKDNTLSTTLYTQNLMLGSILTGLGQYTQAEQNIKKAIDYLLSPASDPYYPPYLKQLNLASAQNSLVRNHIANNDLDNALQLVNTILQNPAILELKNNYEELIYAISLQSLALINLEKGNLEKVEQHINTSIDLLKKNKALDEQKFSQTILARYLLKTNQKEKAYALLQDIITHARQENLLYQEKEALAIVLKSTSQNTNEIFNRFEQVTQLINKDANSLHNTFARIKLETDELLQQNHTLTKQKQWITSTFLFILLMSTLLFSYFFFRQKNKQLKTVQVLQKDTEKYYDSILQIQNELSLARNLERKKIGQDLHDSITNKVFITRFLLEQISPQDFENKRSDLIKEIQEIETNIRSVSHALAKDNVFTSNSFCLLLRDLVLLQNRNNKTDFTFEMQEDLDLDLESLDTKTKIHIYRIVQEALQNVQKYAQASTCKVEIKKVNYKIILSVTDNGIGFKVAQNSLGIGLSNIKARTRLINGKFEIQSVLKQGTTLQITFTI